MKGILKIVKNEIKKNYYDPNFKGIDIEARFQAAEEKLNTATSTTQSLGIIAQAVIDFNDSHLYLLPPSTGWKVDYGWRSTFYGDKCIITDVKPGSDAEAKGIKPGDQLIAVGGFKVNRKEMWKVHYYYNTISKRKGMNLTVLAPGAEEPKTLDIASELKQGPQVVTFNSYFRFDDDFYNEENDKHRFLKVGGINIWRMPGWDFESTMADSLIGRVNHGTVQTPVPGKTAEAHVVEAGLVDADLGVLLLAGLAVLRNPLTVALVRLGAPPVRLPLGMGFPRLSAMRQGVIGPRGRRLEDRPRWSAYQQ